MVYILLGMQKTLKGCFIDWTLYSNTFPQGAGMRIRTSMKALFKSRGFLQYGPVVISIFLFCDITYLEEPQSIQDPLSIDQDTSTTGKDTSSTGLDTSSTGQDTTTTQDTSTTGQNTSAVNFVDDYLALEVGNTWTYSIFRLSAYRDSSISTITITGNDDSAWYFSVRDSIYYRALYRDDPSAYLSNPIVGTLCDTCIRYDDSLNCVHHCYDNLFSTSYSMMSTLESGSVFCGDSSYNYIRSIIKSPVDISDIYYIEKIGLVRQNYSHTGPGAYSASAVLIKFNGIENNLCQCLPAPFH